VKSNPRGGREKEKKHRNVPKACAKEKERENYYNFFKEKGKGKRAEGKGEGSARILLKGGCGLEKSLGGGDESTSRLLEKSSSKTTLSGIDRRLTFLKF